jgi:hypothetical protein
MGGVDTCLSHTLFRALSYLFSQAPPVSGVCPVCRLRCALLSPGGPSSSLPGVQLRGERGMGPNATPNTGDTPAPASRRAQRATRQTHKQQNQKKPYKPASRRQKPVQNKGFTTATATRHALRLTPHRGRTQPGQPSHTPNESSDFLLARRAPETPRQEPRPAPPWDIRRSHTAPRSTPAPPTHPPDFQRHRGHLSATTRPSTAPNPHHSSEHHGGIPPAGRHGRLRPARATLAHHPAWWTRPATVTTINRHTATLVRPRVTTRLAARLWWLEDWPPTPQQAQPRPG